MAVEVNVGTIAGEIDAIGTTVGLAATLAVGVLVGNNIDEGDIGEQAENNRASTINVR